MILNEFLTLSRCCSCARALLGTPGQLWAGARALYMLSFRQGSVRMERVRAQLSCRERRRGRKGRMHDNKCCTASWQLTCRLLLTLLSRQKHAARTYRSSPSHTSAVSGKVQNVILLGHPVVSLKAYATPVGILFCSVLGFMFSLKWRD